MVVKRKEEEMRKIGFIVLVVTLCLAGSAFGLTYVESSTGLTTPTLEGGRTELEFADINNDGHLDILFIGDHGSPYVNTDQHGIMVWFGDGTGRWSVYMNGNFGYGGIAVGDANNDGRLDVAYGMHHNYSGVDFGDQILEVALGDGTGRSWIPWDDSLATNGETWGMFGTDFGDFDNDGWLDVGSCSFGGSAGVHVYRNLHNGVWRQCYGFVGGMSEMDFVFGDINKDGNLDFAAAQQNGTVYFGDGRGGFTLTDRNLPPPGTSGHLGISLGDADNDGGMDISFTNAQEGLEVWIYNEGTGQWVDFSGSLPDTGNYEGTQLCDFNRDGYVDLAATSYASAGGKVTVWLGNGAGTWTPDAQIPIPAPGYFSAFRAGGDVDHNGYPDLALVSEQTTVRNRAHVFKESSTASVLSITPVFPRGGEKFFGGAIRFIDWLCAVPAGRTARIRLELSTTGTGGPWSLIADTLREGGRYQWRVPTGVNSTNCYIRYKAFATPDSAVALTPAAFTINAQSGIAEGEQESRGTGEQRIALRVLSPSKNGLTFSYCLPEAGDVRIDVYDALGRLTGVLAEGRKDAGWHRLSRAARPPAGVYFIRLSSGDRQAVRKAVIAR
jgi:hypothetical protein